MMKLKLVLPEEKQAVLDELMAAYSPAPDDAPDKDPDGSPAWTDGKTINEALFAEAFLMDHKLAYCGGSFFTPEGRLEDLDSLRSSIFEELRPYASTGISKKVSNIIDVIRMSAYREDLPLPTDRIHLANGTLFLNGEFKEGKDEIVRSRLPVRYDPDAPEPALFYRFLDELFYPEDQAAIQEYIGYCLLPVTKAQRMLIVKGRGGEGKSQFGTVVRRLFGINAKDGSIGKISDDRFACADLENILIMVDDDMKTDKLKNTSRIKHIVTNQGPMDLERKGEQSHQGNLYVRLIALSNDDLLSLFDRGDGFYRRQLIIDTRPREALREDDPFIAEKMCQEMEGIFLWAYEGLQGLLRQNYRFTESGRAMENRENVKRDANNVIPFLESEGYIRLTEDGSVSAGELYRVYTFWCGENAFYPLQRRSFSSQLIACRERFGIRYDNNVRIAAGRRVWGFHGIEAVVDPRTGNGNNNFSRTYVQNIPDEGDSGAE